MPYIFLTGQLYAGGQHLKLHWVQLRVQQHRVTQKEDRSQGTEFRTEPAEGPGYPEILGSNPKIHHFVTMNLNKLWSYFTSLCLGFFSSKMGTIMIIIATTSLKGLLKDEMSFYL